MSRALVLAPILVAAIAFGIRLGDAQADPAPIVVASDAQRFEHLDDLVTASDAVVLAEVVDTGPGRALGTGDTAVTTQLVELRVVDVVAGAADPTVILEEPVALADGTPISVDGVAALEPGRRGVFFVLLGAGDADPYAVTVGPQGSYLVDGDELIAPTDDPLATSLAERGGPSLVDAIGRIDSA